MMVDHVDVGGAGVYNVVGGRLRGEGIVGFCGAGGTGKTTTAKLMADLMGWDFVPSVSRRVFDCWGWTEADQINASRHDNWRLQRDIIQAKSAQDFDADRCVMDRTLIDHYVYSLYRSSEVITNEEHKWLDGWLEEGMSRYRFVIFCPVGLFVPGEDGMRQPGEAYRHLIDAAIRGILDRCNVTNLRLPLGTPEERARMCLEAVMNSGFLG